MHVICEQGTPAIGECVGLGAACDYLSAIGMHKIHEHETYLTEVGELGGVRGEG